MRIPRTPCREFRTAKAPAVRNGQAMRIVPHFRTPMKRVLLAALFTLLIFPASVFSLTDADEVALKQLTKEYASWVYSGRPIEFRNRLDYESYEEQRRILIKLAELQWRGTWGDYWRRHGVDDLRALRTFSPKEFWLHFHSTLRPSPSDRGSSNSLRTSVEVHAITEARGIAYVIYQVAHPSRAFESDDDFLVLRAHRSDGEWRLVALPSVTAKLRRELDAAAVKKNSKE
ncbi:MAG: hypothetical protein ABIP85_01120 [Chthoniobacteraceae bacterium]